MGALQSCGARVRGMGVRHTTETIEQQLAAIPTFSRAALIVQWTSAYGRPPPKGLSRRMLENAAAFHIQSQALGGLTAAFRRQLRAARSRHGAAPTMPRKASGRSLAPGSRLVRTWHGRTYTVEILENGFLCNDRHYASLSEIARHITGVRWSGPRFFGI